jgi:5-hydroxyisourate hydrolase
MAGKLTTHVLDTARGEPASGIQFRLFRCAPDHGGARQLLVSGCTNADGRSDGPLLEAEQFDIGHFSLEFDVADYLERTGQAPADAFLDIVALNFRISDASRHTHVPLLLSPFGYTTYRGS